MNSIPRETRAPFASALLAVLLSAGLAFQSGCGDKGGASRAPGGASPGGPVKEIVFQDCWTTPDLPVSYVRNMARRMLSRLRNGRRTVTFRLEMKDASLNVGDFISISHRHIVSPTGALLVRPYVIIAKQEISESVVEYEAYDLAYAGRFARFMADTATDDYDTATATEKGLGCYFGDADNRVGELVELGYDFW